MRHLGHSGRVDNNHTAIVLALRAIGATVQSLASVSGGCPDLVVGYHGRNVLLEVTQVQIEESFHAMSLADQEATLRVLAYIHRRDTEDAEIKKATAAE